MTLDEALLYDAEWWISDPKIMPANHNSDISNSLMEHGYSGGLSCDQCSWFCLLVREAIRNE